MGRTIQSDGITAEGEYKDGCLNGMGGDPVTAGELYDLINCYILASYWMAYYVNPDIHIYCHIYIYLSLLSRYYTNIERVFVVHRHYYLYVMLWILQIILLSYAVNDEFYASLILIITFILLFGTLR